MGKQVDEDESSVRNSKSTTQLEVVHGSTKKRVSVRLLGRPEITRDTETVTVFRSHRILALLGFLTFHRGWRSRDQVADALWPDREPESARHNLRQTILYTRQILGTDSILVDGTSISLNPEIQVDVDDLLRVQNRAGSQEEMLEIASQALESRKGLFLNSLADEWLVIPRAQLDNLYIVALLRLADHASIGQPQQALELLELVIAEEPLLDGARARRIEVLRRLGEHAAAQKEFHIYKKLLQEELGISPSPIVEDALHSKPESNRASAEEAPLDGEDVYEIIRKMAKGARPNQAVELACAMSPHWVSTGRARGGRKSLQDAMDRAGKRMGAFLRERGDLCFAELCMAHGDLNEGLQRLEILHKGPSSPQTQTKALLVSARAATASFNATQAQALLSQARDLAIEHQLVDEEIETYRLQSNISLILDDAAGALTWATEAVGAVEKLSEPSVLADSLLSLAYAQFRNDAIGSAKETARIVSEMMQTTESPSATTIRTSLARLAEEMGETDGVEEAYARGVQESLGYENPFGTAVILTYLGDFLNSQGRFQKP